ncbi:MAG: hypothetical protein M3R37_00320 [Actinomycetota bacterium]|nr:hypothetical protein [Actinomycetota bacterium]
MIDVDPLIQDSFTRIYPVPTVTQDWEWVLRHAGAPRRRRQRPSSFLVSMPRTVRLALIVMALLLVMAGIATATYLAVRAAPAKPGTIAFSRSGDIYIMRGDGSHLRRLTGFHEPRGTRRNHAFDFMPSWSPDGRTLTFTRLVPGADVFIYAINADGSGLQRLRIGAFASWSPDGRAIAAFSGNGIWLMHADGTLLRRLTKNFGYGPTWAPDGTRLAFSTNVGLFVINRDGSDLHRLVNDAGSPAWSPDGRRIAFIRGGKRARLWLINSNGSGLRSLHVRVIEDSSVAWSPDGRRIAFTPRSRRGLYTLNADGGEIRRLSHGLDGTPAWLP